MHAFIYVFSTEDRDKLIAMGYKLIKANDVSGQYIFTSNGNYVFSDSEIKYVMSDVLTF